MDDDKKNLIRKHYRQEAEKDGNSPLSTMADQVVREKEVELIKGFLGMVRRKISVDTMRILDAGCGNGYTLEVLHALGPSFSFYGLEFTDEMLEIARNRNLAGCVLDHGDIISTHYEDCYFDVVYTERCLINILDSEEQQTAIREIARILKPSGYYLMIEGFIDGLANNNKARREMGLEEDINPAYHNLYFDKDQLFPAIRHIFQVVHPVEIDAAMGEYLAPSNFLSSHYFIARILHPLITKGEWVRNTEFVKFFSFLPPIGNYAPIKAYILKKL